MELLGFDVTEITDFGLPTRVMYNEIDRVQEFLQRVKQAINRANKTELVSAVRGLTAPRHKLGEPAFLPKDRP